MEKIDILEQDIADISMKLLIALLKDKSTGKNILWATDNYLSYGEMYSPEKEITPELIIGNYTNIIQPRTSKAKSEQLKRTRDNAEVFTPSWICNYQNNLVDEKWFGQCNVFNRIVGETWVENTGVIRFPYGKTWTDYIYARRIEITCGEAPYLVSRYDTVTGEPIELNRRIGILDRKLRIINENTNNKEDWIKWAIRAFQSTYGYEYQGDNILLARENLLITFFEYYMQRFNEEPPLNLMKKISTIIVWNIWQMDATTLAAPFSEREIHVISSQLNLYDSLGLESENIIKEPAYCRIYDWRRKRSLEFRTLIDGGAENEQQYI